MSDDQPKTTRDLEGRDYATGLRYDWHTAYTKWLPSATAEGHTEIRDAFRAGYLRAVRDMIEINRGQ